MDYYKIGGKQQTLPKREFDIEEFDEEKIKDYHPTTKLSPDCAYEVVNNTAGPFGVTVTPGVVVCCQSKSRIGAGVWAL